MGRTREDTPGGIPGGLNARARQLVVRAEEEARALNNDGIGTGHLLLSLIDGGDGIGVKALEDLGIDLAALRQRAEGAVSRGWQAPHGQIPLTSQARKALELSRQEARSGDGLVGTEHILLGLIRERGTAAQVLAQLGVRESQVRQQVDLMRLGRVRTGSGRPWPSPPRMPWVEKPEPARPAELLLDRFSQNLIQQAREGKLGPVIGRDHEIERVIEILSREARNNPVLVGGNNTGRAAVVEGLAQKIANGEAPEAIRSKQLYRFDPDAVSADYRAGKLDEPGLQLRAAQLAALYGPRAYQRTISRIQLDPKPAGEVQQADEAATRRDAPWQQLAGGNDPERPARPTELDTLIAILAEGRSRDDVIVFIDNLPRVAGSAGITLALGPVLAGGELRVIGAATYEDYRTSIEGDEGSWQMQPVHVAEHATSYAIGMLKIALRAATQAGIPSGEYAC